MKRVISAVCCIALCAIPALSNAKGRRAAPMSDQQFVDFAAQTDMVEANLGQLAENVAASRGVKDYAQMLVTDHTNDYHQLQQQAGFTVPNAIDTENNKILISRFHKLNGAKFDRRYIQTMVAGHTKAIAVFQKEAVDAQSPILRSYALQDLSVLQKHLEGAQTLENNKAK